MKNKVVIIALVVLVFSCNIFEGSGQVKLTQKVKPIYDGNESTALSIYDANPESPDGQHLSFILYPEIAQGGHAGPVVKAFVMIKCRETGETRKIYEINTTNHNGANAIWVNDSLIAFQVNHLKDFEVFNIASDQSMFGLINGELGHKSFQNNIYYSVCNSRLTSINPIRDPYKSENEGINCLNCITGEIKQVATKEQIISAFISQNSEITGNQVSILHVEPNPKGDKILFDYRHVLSSEKKPQLQGFMNADGTGIRWIPTRPMHVVWYDNNSMLGVDTKDPEKKIYRFDLYGKKLELLGGRATHVGTTPNREWYVGESAYYKPEKDGYIRVYLYKKGNPEPVALISEWKNNKITWSWVAHVDPSFSADGKRAYFIRAVNKEDKFEAVCIDLSDIILSKKY